MTAALSYDQRADRAVRLRLKPAQYVERFGPPARRCAGCDHAKPDEHTAGGRLDRMVLADIAGKASWRFDSWGEGAFPSIEGVAARTGYCVRSVQYALRRLERDGYLELMVRPGRTNVCRIVRTVEPIGSVELEPEPVDSAVDELVPASPKPAPVAPGGASVAPDRVHLPTDRTPPTPRSGSPRSSDGAVAPAHAPPKAARGAPAAGGTSPPAPAHAGGEEPHRRDAGPRRASAAPPPSPGVLAGVAELHARGSTQPTESDPLPVRWSRRVTRQQPCPRCSAPPGEACRNRDGRLRKANHAERRTPPPPRLG